MNIKKVEKSVKKINQLLENIKEENAVSTIERDLLLSYIRDLYEKVLVSNDESNKKSSPSTQQQNVYSSQKKETQPSYTPPPVEIADVVRQEIKNTTQQAAQTIPPIEMEKQILQEETIPEPIMEVVQEVPQAPQELLDLFEAGAGNELSDKLGRSPIADLTKSMGINERIFTVNELFGGDTALFNTTMSELDKLSSLEQARDYLVNNVAIHHNWASDNKIKKVANFVKLVSRRY